MNFLKQKYNFSKSLTQVLLIQDCFPLGLQGQVVKVKPGFAINFLLPKQKGVYNFPGIKERIFPNLNEFEIENRLKFYKEKISFEKKIKNINFDMMRAPSFINPSIPKEPIEKKDIIHELNNRYQIELKPEDLILKHSINQFGLVMLEAREYQHPKLNQKYNFQIRVGIRRQEEIKQIDKKEKGKEVKEGKAKQAAEKSKEAEKEKELEDKKQKAKK